MRRARTPSRSESGEVAENADTCGEGRSVTVPQRGPDSADSPAEQPVSSGSFGKAFRSSAKGREGISTRSASLAASGGHTSGRHRSRPPAVRRGLGTPPRR